MIISEEGNVAKYVKYKPGIFAKRMMMMITKRDLNETGGKAHY